MTNLQAALAYAAKGWHVFPVRPPAGDPHAPKGSSEYQAYKDSKRPIGDLVPNGHLEATTDEAAIRSWWGQRPDARIGLAGGPSGLLPVDWDTYKEKQEGVVGLKEIAEGAGRRLPATLTARTSSGGEHLYYRLPPGDWTDRRESATSAVCTKINGYTILPSEGSGYTWAHVVEPAELPEALVAALLKPEPAAGPGPSDDADVAERQQRLVDHVAELGLGEYRWKNGIGVDGKGRVILELEDCPFDPAGHSAPWKAFLGVGSDGGTFAGCVVDGCAAASWADIRPARKLGQKVKPPRQGRFKRASEIEEKEVDWLWDGWLPLGKVTLLAGEPSAAKTFIAMRIAAAVSQGEPLPGDKERRDPAGVLYLSFEDGADDTLKPRARRMGADLHRLLIADAETAPRAGEIGTIDEEIVAEGVKLLVIDPMDSYIGGGADTGLANKVRDALADTVSLAQRHNIAVLIIHHVNKGVGTAMHRISGSLGGFVGLVRVAWIAGQHDGQKALACGKNNLSEFPPTLGYTIEDIDGPGTRSGVAKWGATLPDVTANDLTAPPKRETAQSEDTKELLARGWLAQRLQSAGWTAVEDLQREVREGQPFSWSLVKEAKLKLGVHSRRTQTVPSRSEWCFEGRATDAFAS